MAYQKWEVLEDNAGGLHLAVFDLENDGVEYIHSGYETEGDQLLEDIELLKSGEADPVNDWDGNAEDPQGLYDELVNSRETSIVADDDGVYYSKMGNAVKRQGIVKAGFLNFVKRKHLEI